MNERLQQSLATILEKATAGVEAGVGFLSTEIPDVVRQLLVWKAAESVFVAIMCVLIIFACINIHRKKLTTWYMHEKDKHLGDQFLPIFTGILVWVIFGIPAFFVFIFESMEIAKIWLAPKIYLIEYAASLAK